MGTAPENDRAPENQPTIIHGHVWSMRVIRRGQPPLLGEWSLPGGVLECGETLCEATVREVREETGLVVETGEMLGVYERVIHSEVGRVRYHYVLIDFLCRVLGGDLAAGTDAADVRWFGARSWTLLICRTIPAM